MKRIAEQMADWLVRQHLEQVYTVTGGGAMFLNQALCGHPGLRSVFMHHEQACAMAAEGYARIAGKPAVVMPTTGPGSINTLNGVFGAYTDSIPMLILSGQVKRETCKSFYDLPTLRQLGDQEGPTVALARELCKFAEIVREPADLKRLLPAALRAAISGRPGPAWLDLPLDIQQSTEPVEIPDLEPEARPSREPLREACREIVARLRQAHRPLLIGGTGVRLAGVADRLLRLVERMGIPMATAWTHDTIPSDHPLFAGRPGTIGTRPGNFCQQNADLLLVLGSRLNIRQTSYHFSGFASRAWVAQVDIDPAELEKPTVRPDLGVVADLRLFLDVLEEELEKVRLPSYAPWAEKCREWGERYDIRREHRQQPGAPRNPYLVVDRIFQQLRSTDLVVCGNASACILPFQMGRLRKEQRLFSNSGSASMGYDLPAAIGAANAGAAESRRVICFAGDGSLQMNIQELQTLATLQANVVIIVLNNRGYLSIWQTHENFFGKVVGATPETGVEFPDFVAVAKAYRVRSVAIRGEADLAELDRWLTENGPLLIDIEVDPRQEFAPRIKSRVDEHGKFVTPELDDMHPFLPPEELEMVRQEAERIEHLSVLDDREGR